MFLLKLCLILVLSIRLFTLTCATTYAYTIQAVIRYLHHSTPTEDIMSVFIDMGFSVCNVCNIQNKNITKAPLPLFFEPIKHNQNYSKYQSY